MSHVTDVRTQLKDLDCLVDALVAKGIAREDIEIHEKAVTFETMGGGISSGNVIVRKATIKKLGGAGWNDLAFELVDDGTYMACIDRDERRFGQSFLDGVSQQYGVIKTKKECDAAGLMLTDETVSQEDGSVLLVFEEL